VLDNAPKIPADKLPKLTKVISKICGTHGTVVNIEMPIDEETSKTLGFAFVVFQTKEQANLCVDGMSNGYKLDKKHILIASLMSDFDKYMDTPEDWNSPSEREFEEKENLQWWMYSKNCEDQFAIRHDTMTEVMWCRKNDVSPCQTRDRWADTSVAWSPNGTYMATFHRQGIALYAGKKWARTQRFSHSAVKFIEISPCEKYIVTLSADAPANPQDPQAIIIWDIKTGEKKRGFDVNEGEQERGWPVFKWSHDDKYCARLIHKKAGPDGGKAEDMISIYETPGMHLLDKKSLKISEVQDFSWSPTDNVVAYWTPEIGERPARLSITAIPSREELTSKNFVQVKECKLVWQKSGDHLCVAVERHNKRKTATYWNFCLFHMREKLIPCDIVELEERVKLGHCAWEPTGTKFAIIHGEAPRICCSVYDLADGKVTLVKCLDKVQANHISWSPRGRYLILAGLGQMQGVFEFIDTATMEPMNQGEHFMASEVLWDPTGRYVITVVSFLRHQSDTGYYVWSFQGKLLQKYIIPKFYSLEWRPQPPSLLSAKDIQWCEKNYKQYQAEFEAQDKLTMNAASAEVRAARNKLLMQWEDFQEKATYYLSKRSSQLAALRPATDDDMVQQEVEEIVAEFLSETIDILDRI
jgi:translation initiation factor 3 subunit B